MSAEYVNALYSKTINLRDVISWQDTLRDEARPNDEPSLVVEMRDGTFATLEGGAESEAFMQAMDHHLGADLF